VIDATILKSDATQDDVNALCDTANDHKCASVCVNSWFSHYVRLRITHPVKSCTVINFPLGANCLEAVVDEAGAVLTHSVEEVDMVQNLAALLSGHPALSFDMIKAVAEVCHASGAILKVILETSLLSPEQIVVSCLQAKKAGADFVKTSTGFSSAGATEENIRLMRSVVGPKLGVKASGGIRTRQQAEAMLAAGANRIGASSVTALL
jgi:deoxyribose-phosphate aldolase